MSSLNTWIIPERGYQIGVFQWQNPYWPSCFNWIQIDQIVFHPQIPVGRGDEGPDGGQGFRQTCDGTIDHGVLPPRIHCPVRRGLHRRGALRRTCGLRTRTGDNEGSGKQLDIL